MRLRSYDTISHVLGREHGQQGGRRRQDGWRCCFKVSCVRVCCAAKNLSNPPVFFFSCLSGSPRLSNAPARSERSSLTTRTTSIGDALCIDGELADPERCGRRRRPRARANESRLVGLTTAGYARSQSNLAPPSLLSSPTKKITLKHSRRRRRRRALVCRSSPPPPSRPPPSRPPTP